MTYDEFAGPDGGYSVSNIYYDTINNDLIRTSLAKPRYREKVRLRAYGNPGLDSIVFAEIKKKVSKNGNKRRSPILLSDAYMFLNSGKLPEETTELNMQVLKEIKYILDNKKIFPVLYLAYDRIAFQGIDKSVDFRVSFDQNIVSRRYDLKLEAGRHGDRVTDKNTVIMEIKVTESIPVWFTKLLSKCEVYAKGFSKYGVEYQNWLKNKPRDLQKEGILLT